MKIAAALIVKGVDEEAVVLRQCLQSLYPYMDRIFITITRKENEEINEKVKKVCEDFQATISEFIWVNDFAKARNFNFSQVPKDYDYILWCDADDVFRGLNKLKEVLEDNEDKDAFYLNYLYSFDKWKNPNAVHPKVQIIRNNDSMVWKRRIHEDLCETRQIRYGAIKEVERLHMTTDERFLNSTKRNLEIALEEVGEFPNDPRVYWNLANSYIGVQEWEKSNEQFKKFIELSSLTEENYLASLRMAGNLWNLGNKMDAIKMAQSCLGMLPEIPDAYFTLGMFYRDIGQLMKARELMLSGLAKKPPIQNLSIWNPRDYDYNPLMILGQIYTDLNMPGPAISCFESCLKIYPQNEELKRFVDYLKKEVKPLVNRILKWVNKLKDAPTKEEFMKIYNRIPDNLKESPHISLVKNEVIIRDECTDKDITFYCGGTVDEWNPEIARTKGIGGSEEAVIHLAKRFAKAGYNVEVFNSCGFKEQEYDGVKYKPFWMWNHRDKHNILIFWRNFAILDTPLRAEKIYIDMHDVMPEGEITPERQRKINKIFVKSNFHRSLYPQVPDDKFVIIPNGIDPEAFNLELEKDQYLMINTSSPDRSLSGLVDMFTEVKKRVPEAKLKWAYGWKVFDAVHANKEYMMKWKEELVEKMEKLGVENLGRISHEEVAKLYQTANVFAYPTEFAEIHCISAAKAQAGGALPITTDFAALDETVQYGVKIHSEKNKDNWALGQFDFSLTDEKMKQEWIDKVVETLQTPIQDRAEMRTWAKQRFDWDNIANEWIKIIN